MEYPMVQPHPRGLVLFDIDGTLLRRAGPHHRQALIEAVRRATGVETTIEGVPVSGMLDRDIVTQMLWFAVRVGSFRNPDNARRTQVLMQQKFGDAVSVQREGELWRVLIGSVMTRVDAETLAAAVRQSDLAYRSAYVVQVGQ